jgi:hypothetical protein
LHDVTFARDLRCELEILFRALPMWGALPTADIDEDFASADLSSLRNVLHPPRIVFHPLTFPSSALTIPAPSSSTRSAHQNKKKLGNELIDKWCARPVVVSRPLMDHG